MARLHVREFLARFVQPLIAGGELHVGAPIPMADLARWDGELADASVEQVAADDARHAVVAPLVCQPPPLLLEAEDLALAAGLHNALFLVHPRAERWSVTDRVRRRIIDTALVQVGQPLTADRRRLLGRHALLHNLFRLRRHDVTVSWWAGRARFSGQRPPARLTAWPSVRRVREDAAVVDFEELLAVPDTAPIVATLARRTPLTQLLDAHPAAPPVHWEDAIALLRDAELARTVSYHVIPDGAPREQIAGPARLAAAFEQMLERTPAAADVRAVAAFLIHLTALLCFGERALREPGAKSPLLAAVLAAEVAGQRPRGLATLLALPNAMAEVDPRLAVPPGVGADARLAARWSVHRAQVAEQLGDAVIEALAHRLRRLIGGPRPAAISD